MDEQDLWLLENAYADDNDDGDNEDLMKMEKD
jgi:hypothetical protein